MQVLNGKIEGGTRDVSSIFPFLSNQSIKEIEMTTENIPQSPITQEQRLRFWSRVALTADDSQCWNWMAHCSKSGYGAIYWYRKTRRAHRVAWLLTFGYMPSLHVLHSCDNTKCVNPKHLREGTQKENMEDVLARKRRVWPFGDKVPKAKVTNAQVIEIRQRLSHGETPNAIARQFPITANSVRGIKRGDTWKRLEEADTVHQYSEVESVAAAPITKLKEKTEEE